MMRSPKHHACHFARPFGLVEWRVLRRDPRPAERREADRLPQNFSSTELLNSRSACFTPSGTVLS